MVHTANILAGVIGPWQLGIVLVIALLIFGGAFQTPIVVYIINWLGLITLKQLKKWRPYVLLVITIIAAAITPTGPIILVVLAGPMYLLYEFGILLCMITGRKKD